MINPPAMSQNHFKQQADSDRATVFFRNDDVRGSLDNNLVYLTEKLVSAGFPISHAVEPANVSREVVDWLLAIKAAYPGRVEILQHGYEHRIKTKPPHRGEFGGNRAYEEQLNEIRKGVALMSTHFADHWTRIFSFPYGAYNHNTLKALEMCGFKMISTGVRFTRKRKILNYVGHMFKMSRFMGYNIVYFSEKKPKYSLYDFPVMLNNTKRQTGPDAGVQLSCDELRGAWRKVPPRYKTRGILCHHRFNSQTDIEQLLAFLKVLKDEGVRFSTIGGLYEEVDRL